MALRLGGARSIMNAYTDIDGVPAAADRRLLTDLLRGAWGFRGTVVSDYFALPFLVALHGVAANGVDAAALALEAGIDVELPTVHTLGPAFVEAVRAGQVDEALVDTALERVLRQKAELGLLDPDWSARPPALSADGLPATGSVDLDPQVNRDLARRIAERAIVLVRNDGTLPVAPERVSRIAVIGPNADDPYAVLGCYSFPSHVGRRYPDLPLGIALPTLLESIRVEFPTSDVDHVLGTTIDGGDTGGIPAAVALAKAADLVVLALGDRAGLFGGGTSGEGCDAASLRLPGAQQELLDAVLASGRPVVVVLMAGRPYALGAAALEAAGILQAFFAGEEGTPAIAGVLSGRVNPSGRLPVSVPANEGAQPSTYLAAALAERSGVSNVDLDPGVRVRPRARLQPLRVGAGSSAGRVADGWPCRGRRPRHQCGRSGRCRRGAALLARPGRERRAPGPPVDRLRAGRTGCGGQRDHQLPAFRRPGVVHRCSGWAHRRAGRRRAPGREVQRGCRVGSPHPHDRCGAGRRSHPGAAARGGGDPGLRSGDQRRRAVADHQVRGEVHAWRRRDRTFLQPHDEARGRAPHLAQWLVHRGQPRAHPVREWEVVVAHQ